MTTRRTYTTPCAYGCGHVITSRIRPPAAGLTCGRGDCLTRHNAEADARRSRTGTTRRPRPSSADIPGGWGDVGRLVVSRTRTR